MRIDFENYKTLKDLTDFIMVSKECDRKAATEWCRSNVPKESYYQTKIIGHLKKKYPDSFVRKYSAGAFSSGGVPDILFIHKGRYIGFEVKRPYFGTVSELQKQTIKDIRRAGGVAEVVTYISEVDKIINILEDWRLQDDRVRKDENQRHD